MLSITVMFQLYVQTPTSTWSITVMHAITVMFQLYIQPGPQVCGAFQ
jgi:hypothetical protein